MKLPGQKTWSAGTCMAQAGPRSYEVKVGETVYRRNRRQLIQSKEPPIVDSSEPEPSTSSTETQPQQIEQANQPPTQASSSPDSQAVCIRRSQRTRRPPAHLKDFVTE